MRLPIGLPFTNGISQRLLVLRGPAGSGKTTTITLLSEALDFDLIEWRNPAVSEFSAQEYVSVSAHFEEFLGRGDRLRGLDLEDSVESKKGRDAQPRSHRVLLIEEFPTILNRNSSSLAAFRASLQRYLAASTEQSLGGLLHPPIVMIVSETLLSSASSISDNLTVHRLLGPSLYNHIGTTIIDFNSIASTFMQKALRLVLEKEAQTSQRSRIPGSAVLDKIADIGDIRSALSALEFLCLKGDQAGKWSGSLTKTKKPRGGSTLTSMEHESLEMISQREASLGMFHAVGKIAYNKRLDPSLTPNDVPTPPSPPDHLAHHRRVKVSQVAVNELLDETGTDVSTFISALHENFPQSCEGDSFTDSFNACIEALSDCDILSADRKPFQSARTGVGIGATPLNAGVDMLRQDEISFQVAARGLLFALPYPVKRKPASVNGRKPVRPAYQMLYPASLRLWRRTEEIEGLVDTCLKQMLDPTSDSRILARGPGAAESAGVKSWKNLRLGYSSVEKNDGSLHSAVTMMSRPDALLHYLPYMAQIRRKEPDGWHLNQITSIQDGYLDAEMDDDVDEDELAPTVSQSRASASLNGNTFRSPVLATDEEKLILSDDDIVDD
ncbi:Checkpoint protein rad17 [Penicillium rolfsii]|nr:Checkpoint protein rad17 [Penicillium rolfsii]